LPCCRRFRQRRQCRTGVGRDTVKSDEDQPVLKMIVLGRVGGAIGEAEWCRE
jgi:hypothetical protein